MSTTTTPPSSGGFHIRGILVSMVLNAAIPFGLYELAKGQFHTTDLVALLIAAIFPLVDSIFEVIRHRSFDLIAMLALLGIVVSVVGILLGGDEKILLIRESFLTGALGIFCFISLLLPRPFMFYFGRQMMAGNDPAKRAAFDAQWQHPYARFVHRLITIVWGVAYVGEFVLRVVLVYTLSAALVLAISPFLIGGVTIATLLWTFSYVRYAQKRGVEMRRQQELVNAGTPRVQ